MKTFQILAAAGLATVAQAHMEMIWPPPFKSKANPNAGQDVDYSMTSPLDASGSDYPCKGYQSVLGTAGGKSVVDWTPGEKYNLTLSGSAIHGGGSCQASLSYDKAKTFTAIHSFIGNCPTGPVDLEFAIPSDTPAGEAVFAWTWFNEIGNREMYMNCASITIAGGSSKRDTSDAFDSRPAMFVANVNNGCSTTEGKDVKFPDAGPDVTNGGSNTGPPVGSCASGSGSGGGDDGGDTGGDAPTTTAETPEPTTTAAQDPTNTVPGGIFITATDTAAPEPTEPVETEPASPTATPSTMVTVTTPSTPNPTPTNGGGGGSDGGSGGFAQGTACTSEGDWNCVGGSQFQRCASGMWSALISMAGGTSCSPGQSSTLSMHKRRGGSRIYNV